MERPRYGVGYAILDLRTGEVVDTANEGEHFIAAQEGDHVYNKAQINYNERQKKLKKNFLQKEKFHKTFDKSKALADELFVKTGKLKAYAMMNILQGFVYFDGSIRIGRKFATTADLAKLYNVSRQAMGVIINQLVEDEVLAKCETGIELNDGTRKKSCLLYNPYIAVRAKDVPAFLVELFRNSKWNVYDGKIDDEVDDEIEFDNDVDFDDEIDDELDDEFDDEDEY